MTTAIPNLTIVDHPLVQHKLTLMRKKDTSTAKFRILMRELSLLLGYEVTRHLPTHSISVETPICTTLSPVIYDQSLALISILRAGNGLLEGMLELMPTAHVGYVGLYRDHVTCEPVEYYYKVPTDLDKRTTIVLDPMLATGHSAVAAISKLKKSNPQSLSFVCLLAAPEGVACFKEAHPDIPIYTAALDERLNEKNYIVPGLGDAGDRLFGTL